MNEEMSFGWYENRLLLPLPHAPHNSTIQKEGLKVGVGGGEARRGYEHWSK